MNPTSREQMEKLELESCATKLSLKCFWPLYATELKAVKQQEVYCLCKYTISYSMEQTEVLSQLCTIELLVFVVARWKC